MRYDVVDVRRQSNDATLLAMDTERVRSDKRLPDSLPSAPVSTLCCSLAIIALHSSSNHYATVDRMACPDRQGRSGSKWQAGCRQACCCTTIRAAEVLCCRMFRISSCPLLFIVLGTWYIRTPYYVGGGTYRTKWYMGRRTKWYLCTKWYGT